MTEPSNQPTPTSKQQSQPASRKEVFAPLATYGVVAIGIVAIIITTTIMLNKELNTIERDVSRLESELAGNNAADVAQQANPESAPAVTEPVVADAPATAVPDDTEAVKPVVTADITNEASTVTASESPAATEVSKPLATADATAAAGKPSSLADRQDIRNRLKQRISEQQALIQQQEARQLQQIQAAMDRQIAMLQQQIEHTRELIARIEQRNQQHYAMRAARLEQQRLQRERLMDTMIDRI